MIDGRVREGDRLRFITEPIEKVNRRHLRETVTWLKSMGGARYATGELLARAMAQVIKEG